LQSHRGRRAEPGADGYAVDGLVGGLQESLGQGEPPGKQPLMRGGAGGLAELAGELSRAEPAVRGQRRDRQRLAEPLYRPFQGRGEPVPGPARTATAVSMYWAWPPRWCGGMTIWRAMVLAISAP
jgi:hypothetical protein